jgi:predicted TPR repeat methyltransferase
MPILAWAKRELDRGKVKVAVAWARRLLRADDQLADAYLIIGVAEQAAGHGSAAKTAYRRYLELAPKGRYARDVRLSLAAL